MLRRFAFLALVLALVAGCTREGSETPAPSRGPLGGTLRLGMANGSFFGMDPRDEWNASTWELFRCCLVRTLTSYDVSGSSVAAQPVPDLASGPPEVSSDGLTWTFHLRPGIHYAPPMQDTEITAPDFVRALRRLAGSYDPGNPGLAGYHSQIDGWNEFNSGKTSSIVGLQTPDPLTLRIVQTRPDASLPPRPTGRTST